MNNRLKVVTLTVSVYREGCSPIFGEGVTHISLDDDGAGEFVILSQENNQIRLDFDELKTIFKAAKKLKRKDENND